MCTLYLGFQRGHFRGDPINMTGVYVRVCGAVEPEGEAGTGASGPRTLPSSPAQLPPTSRGDQRGGGTQGLTENNFWILSSRDLSTCEIGDI